MPERNISRRKWLGGMGLTALSPLLSPLQNTTAQGNKKETALHRIMSCNIRVALPEDDTAGVGWNNRKALCTKVIHRYQPDIICMQEVLKVQMDDMRSSFPDYEGFGFDGPEMDVNPSSYQGIAKNPILFSRKRYELRTGGTFWLSETPLIGGSKSWETARARHCNWLRLQDKTTDKEFRILNTHLDHITQAAREKQIQAIITEAAQYADTFPQIFAGDFNSKGPNKVLDLLQSNSWKDSYTAIHGEGEPGFTAHAFIGSAYADDLKAKNASGGKIDFIFTKGPVTAITTEIIKDHEGEKYPSDHYFLYADVKL